MDQVAHNCHCIRACILCRKTSDLRHTFVEWAAASMRHACWARLDSQHQREQGQSHQAAVRALACTWLRVLLRCGQQRTPYDASVYLNAVKPRGAPLMRNVAQGS